MFGFGFRFLHLSDRRRQSLLLVFFTEEIVVIRLMYYLSHYKMSFVI